MNQALDYLNKDIVLHIDMLDSIQRGNARILEASDRGVLLYNIAGDDYMMSTEDPGTADRMIARIDTTNMLIAHQAFYIPAVQNKFSLNELFYCYQAAYMSKEPIPFKDNSLQFKVLDISYLDFVMKHYTHVNDESYIRSRIESGVVIGVFRGDAIAAFMGMHVEGAMGMLEVLLEYRRQGIAYNLEAYYTNHLLSQGYIPYAQIVNDNTASFELHKKLGFTITPQQICWVMG